jgi:hypothetical protein
MTEEKASFQKLVNVSTDNESKTQYLLTLQDARIYLSLGKNSFNKYIRPQVNELRVGRRVMFRTIDLEAVAEDNLQRYRCPDQSQGELKWDKIKCQDSLKGVTPGTLTNKSAEDEFSAVLARRTAKRRSSF